MPEKKPVTSGNILLCASRSSALLQEAFALARQGSAIDLTASTTPEFIAAGEVAVLDALALARKEGVPLERVTVSSDAGGSLPVYVAGELVGLTAATPDILLQTLGEAIRDQSDLLYPVLAALTRNPANALRMPWLGLLATGAPATLLLLDAGSGDLVDVCCRGRWLLRDGEQVPVA